MNLEIINTMAATVAAAGGIAATACGALAWRATVAGSRASTRGADLAEGSEAYRRWDALRPSVKPHISCPGDRNVKVELRLAGPPALDQLDRVTVSIRDDRPNRLVNRNAASPPEEQVRAQIWGPYRLRHGIENTDPTGRTVTFPEGIDLGEDLVMWFEPTLPPPWSSNDSWQQEMENKPIRLTLVAEKVGFQPWSLPLELDVSKSKSSKIW